MSLEEIDRAKTIEKQLENYRLWANMIPSSSFYANLRKFLPKKEWDRVRKIAYKNNNYQCELCQVKDQVLHCHEQWNYSYKQQKQTLVKLMALCFLCHMNQHLGFCNTVLIPKGKLTRKELIEHWMKVNKSTENEYIEHETIAWELWHFRSKFKWKIYDSIGNLIDENYKKMQSVQ